MTERPCPFCSCSALFQLLRSLPAAVRARLAAIAIDGTSATTLLVDAGSGEVLAPPKMYDEMQGAEAVQRAKVGWACSFYALLRFLAGLCIGLMILSHAK